MKTGTAELDQIVSKALAGSAPDVVRAMSDPRCKARVDAFAQALDDLARQMLTFEFTAERAVQLAAAASEFAARYAALFTAVAAIEAGWDPAEL